MIFDLLIIIFILTKNSYRVRMITKLSNYKICKLLEWKRRDFMADYEQTHENIINSAKKCFLEKGFERSNLREICKRAGVTTGAFYRHFSDKESIFECIVEPAVEEFQALYKEMQEEYYELLDDDDLKKVWDLQDDSLEPFIDAIYNNYDAFRLLLMGADGTSHSQFLHQCAEWETRATMKYVREMRRRGFNVPDVSAEEFHMLIQAYFASIFEVVMHDYSKEKAIKYSRTLVRFFKPGWRTLLEF
jgi:AcrR family transcriptional regulator